MKYKVAVVGGGPSGSCAAEILADCGDVEVTLFERKMDNAKPCGGAIPLCMIEEFDLPTSIIDRKVHATTRSGPNICLCPVPVDCFVQRRTLCADLGCSEIALQPNRHFCRIYCCRDPTARPNGTVKPFGAERYPIQLQT